MPRIQFTDDELNALEDALEYVNITDQVDPFALGWDEQPDVRAAFRSALGKVTRHMKKVI